MTTTRSAMQTRLIKAGAKVFAEAGFRLEAYTAARQALATMERLGEAAGVSHQTVRDNFRTPTLLLTAVVAEGWERVLAAMAKTRKDEPIEMVLAAYDAIEKIAREETHLPYCMFHVARCAGPTGNPLIVDERREVHVVIEDAIIRETKCSRGIAYAYCEILISAIEHLAYPASNMVPPPIARDIFTQVVTSTLLVRWAGGRITS